MSSKANRIGFLAVWIVLAATFLARAAEGNDDGSPVMLRVLSYNIHHGEGVDRKLDLERIASVINSVKPDLVALQEVDRGVERTERIDEPRQLAKLTGLEVVFGNNIRYQGGDYGNAVLSRLPIKRHENHPLPSMYDGEQRGLLEVEVALAGQNILFLATHLDYRPDDAERVASAKFINEFVTAHRSQPAILAGDLNALPDSKTLELLEVEWKRANEKVQPTFPAKEPIRQIDFILRRPAGRWRVIECRVLDEAVASDHRAIFAVLELLTEEGK